MKDATEGVRGQLLLSFGLLEGLLPIDRCEFEQALPGPAGDQAQQVAQVDERLDAMQSGAGQQKDEDCLLRVERGLPSRRLRRHPRRSPHPSRRGHRHRGRQLPPQIGQGAHRGAGKAENQETTGLLNRLFRSPVNFTEFPRVRVPSNNMVSIGGRTAEWPLQRSCATRSLQGISSALFSCAAARSLRCESSISITSLKRCQRGWHAGPRPVYAARFAAFCASWELRDELPGILQPASLLRAIAQTSTLPERCRGKAFVASFAQSRVIGVTEQRG
jgi:hypothetical protein